MDANMDELLDLCSGQFSSQAEHVPTTSSNKKQNVEELLNLCSGKFTSQSRSWILLSALLLTWVISFTLRNHLVPGTNAEHGTSESSDTLLPLWERAGCHFYLLSCLLTSFCSRFSNVGIFSVFQGRKRQWHRRSDGRSSGTLFRLLSHRQVSSILPKIYRSLQWQLSCLTLNVFSSLTSVPSAVSKSVACFGGEGRAILQITQWSL